jgi:hypothetical protein
MCLNNMAKYASLFAVILKFINHLLIPMLYIIPTYWQRDQLFHRNVKVLVNNFLCSILVREGAPGLHAPSLKT